MSFYPALHFDYLEPENWCGKDGVWLYELMKSRRIALKNAVHYYWDNDHFFINDLYGKVALIVQFSHMGSISFWVYRTGVYVGTFMLNELQVEEYREMIKEASQGKSPCGECGKWIDNKEIIHYSFAGGVCKECYNPKKHLPADSSD